MTEGTLLDLRAGKWRCNGFEQHRVAHTCPTAREEEVCRKLSLAHDWSRIAAMCLPLSEDNSHVESVQCSPCHLSCVRLRGS